MISGGGGVCVSCAEVCRGRGGYQRRGRNGRKRIAGGGGIENGECSVRCFGMFRGRALQEKLGECLREGGTGLLLKRRTSEFGGVGRGSNLPPGRASALDRPRGNRCAPVDQWITRGTACWSMINVIGA